MSDLFESWGRGIGVFMGEAVVARLGLWQRIILRVRGCVYLEHRRMPGWKGSLPFYYAECPDHGGYEAYPHGRGWVRCPKCFYEVYVGHRDTEKSGVNRGSVGCEEE